MKYGHRAWGNFRSCLSTSSVARFGLFGPNWSFQTSFGPQKLHLVFGLILVFLGHSDWSFGPFWSFFNEFLGFWSF